MPDLRPALPFFLLVAATFAAYWNAWPDILVLDDKLFAGHERFADLSRLPEFFHETVWAPAGADEQLYRPLLMVSVAIDAALFGERVSAYHFVNVVLHVLATLFVYLLLLQLLRRADAQDESAVLVALLAALVFGVHPVHAEVVNSIFNRSSILVAIGSAAGLWWLLRDFETRPARAWTGIWLCYWVVLFSRETGIVLPALAVTLVWIHASGGWRQKARHCLPVLAMTVPMVVYLILRARAVAPPLSPDDSLAGDPLGVTGLVASGSLVEWHSLLQVAGVWLEALRLTLWPWPLLFIHPAPGPLLQIASVFVHIGLVAAALYLCRRGRCGLLAGLAIFYLSWLPASQLFGPVATSINLAERYIYEPSIGLAVLLAFGLRYLLRRGDRLLAAAPIVLAVLVLTPITWARNADWSDEIALLEHDYRHGVRTESLLRMLTSAHLTERNAARVIQVCRENDSEQQWNGRLAVHCGAAYLMTGDQAAAERTFLLATQIGDNSSRIRAHSNLARLYIAQGRRDEARAQFEFAIENEKIPATRAYRRGLMLVQLYPGDREQLLAARAHFEEALRLQPRLTLAIDALERVDRNLERLD